MPGIPFCLLSPFTLEVLIRAADHQLFIPESTYRMLGTLLDAGGNVGTDSPHEASGIKEEANLH